MLKSEAALRAVFIITYKILMKIPIQFLKLISNQVLKAWVIVLGILSLVVTTKASVFVIDLRNHNDSLHHLSHYQDSVLI